MRLLILTGLALLAPQSAEAQSLADRILAGRNGTVRLTYASRPGVCGDGETYIRDLERGGDHYISFEGRGGRRPRGVCDEGPARVAISLFDGSIRRVRVYVGGEWPAPAGGDVRDLGVVSAASAVDAFLTLAERERRGEEVIFAATIADSVAVWPRLLRLARNERVSRDARKGAVFWLSQAAGDSATAGLSELVEDESGDRDVREHAVFALSQLDDDRGVPALIRAAKTNPDPRIRRKAIFWLGQSEDPRALALFEELLTRGR